MNSICLLFVLISDNSFIPANTSSHYEYGITETSKIYVSFAGKTRNLSIQKGNQTRFFRSKDALIVSNPHEMPGLFVFVEDKNVLSFPSFGTPFFAEWDGAYLFCGHFEGDNIFIEKYDKKRRRLAQDVVPSKRRHILYSGGKIESHLTDGYLNLWVPGYDLFLVYDKNLQQVDLQVLRTPNKINKFDGKELDAYDAGFEGQNKKAKAEYLKQHKNDYLQVIPSMMLFREDGPIFVYNILALGAKVRPDGEAEVNKFTINVRLDGTHTQGTTGYHLVGFVGDVLLHSTWSQSKKKRILMELK